MAAPRDTAVQSARARDKRRAAGLTSIEAILHRDDVASLDVLKVRLGLTSRSDVLRVLIAKADPAALSPADAAVLSQSAA